MTPHPLFVRFVQAALERARQKARAEQGAGGDKPIEAVATTRTVN